MKKSFLLISFLIQSCSSTTDHPSDSSNLNTLPHDSSKVVHDIKLVELSKPQIGQTITLNNNRYTVAKLYFSALGVRCIHVENENSHKVILCNDSNNFWKEYTNALANKETN